MPDQHQVLWQLFIHGNKQAFENIMSAHYRYLFNYGTKLCDNKELVKDVIQDLFLKLWEKRSNLSIDVNPKAYLTASLRRALLRKIQAERKFSNHADLNELETKFYIEFSVEEKFIRKEQAKNLALKIAAKLADIPARQREVVYLKFFHGLSRNEISETMQIKHQTVSNLLQFALKKLKGELVSKLTDHITLSP